MNWWVAVLFVLVAVDSYLLGKVMANAKMHGYLKELLERQDED